VIKDVESGHSLYSRWINPSGIERFIANQGFNLLLYSVLAPIALSEVNVVEMDMGSLKGEAWRMIEGRNQHQMLADLISRQDKSDGRLSILS
jgi:hypothetical protein